MERPEYLEFPWVEGIINAIAHRDYAASGQFIKVSMFDDRLEIESPGRFPDIVTADNISYTRFSRNKMISRVMTEFEWVRELNEGVKKIYSDMAEAGLPAPEYIETPNTVKLIPRNNIDERRNKVSNKALNENDLHLGHFDQDSDQDVNKIIHAFCKEPHSAKEIMDYIKIADRSFFRRHYLNPMIKSGQLKMTIPDKLKSGNQKYYAHSN